MVKLFLNFVINRRSNIYHRSPRVLSNLRKVRFFTPLDKPISVPQSEHYLDGFLFAGPPNSNLCQFTRYLFKQINNHIGLTILIDKNHSTKHHYNLSGHICWHNSLSHAAPSRQTTHVKANNLIGAECRKSQA